MDGIVVAAHGRQYWVDTTDGRRLPCVPRGKKSEIACGDRVMLSLPSSDQGCIERIEPRQSLLYRSNEFRQKLIAANLTQIVIVLACEPPFSEDVLNRCLIAAEDQDLHTLIVLNKVDLADKRVLAETVLAPYTKLGYKVLALSAHMDIEPLREALRGHHSVLVGQSGMGKSTLTNALIPEAKAPTREISEALQSGKHTTTHATLYRLPNDAEGWLIDSPGLQEFGLAHLDADRITRAMPEFSARVGECRFRDCRHDREPGCAILEAFERQEITFSRYTTFRNLVGGG